MRSPFSGLLKGDISTRLQGFQVLSTSRTNISAGDARETTPGLPKSIHCLTNLIHISRVAHYLTSRTDLANYWGGRIRALQGLVPTSIRSCEDRLDGPVDLPCAESEHEEHHYRIHKKMPSKRLLKAFAVSTLIRSATNERGEVRMRR